MGFNIGDIVGAVGGAVLGSVLLPGLGTVAGGAIGGALGTGASQLMQGDKFDPLELLAGAGVGAGGGALLGKTSLGATTAAQAAQATAPSASQSFVPMANATAVAGPGQAPSALSTLQAAQPASQMDALERILKAQQPSLTERVLPTAIQGGATVASQILANRAPKKRQLSREEQMSLVALARGLTSRRA